MIGERLKHAFVGNDAWILSYREECFDQIGLKPSVKTPLFNGPLECEFRKYQIFDGKYKEFKSQCGACTLQKRRCQNEAGIKGRILPLCKGRAEDPGAFQPDGGQP